MATASIFQNYVQLVEHKALIIITKQIQEGNYKEQVEAIRKLIAEGQDKEADKLKKQLPAFTPSGTFENGRKAELLTQYSGFVILDLDKLSPEDLEKAKSLVALAPYTFAAFISPSGNGLKIIVPVNSTAEHHKLAFQQVSVCTPAIQSCRFLVFRCFRLPVYPLLYVLRPRLLPQHQCRTFQCKH